MVHQIFDFNLCLGATRHEFGHHAIDLGIECIDAIEAQLGREQFIGFLRGQVARNVRLKFAPELHFQPDSALDYAMKIDQLMRQPQVVRDLAKDLNISPATVSEAWQALGAVGEVVRGLVVAAVFCFILSFGDFVAPYYLGGSKPPTLSIMIVDTSKSGQQWPRAAVVAIMMIITLLIVAFTAIGFAYRKRGK